MKSNFLTAFASLALAGTVFAGNESKPLADPVLDAPTFRSLGGYWVIQGDDNANATVNLSYRKTGAKDWTTGMPLLRVEKNAHDPAKAEHKDKEISTSIDVPDGAWL